MNHPDDHRLVDAADLPERRDCPTPLKVSYATRRLAKNARRRAKGAGNARRNRVHAYLCVCNRWHLGSVADADHLARIRAARS